MIGSIIGDIAGSIYEFTPNNIKTKEFDLFSPEGSYTDDSILTVATADWLLHGGEIAHYYSRYGQEYPYPMGGYGGSFFSGLYALPLNRITVHITVAVTALLCVSVL